MNEEQKMIVKRLNELCEHEGIKNSYQAALICGVSQRAFYNWIQGNPPPKEKALRRIANGFKIRVQYFTDPDVKSIEDYRLDIDAPSKWFRSIVLKHRELKKIGDQRGIQDLERRIALLWPEDYQKIMAWIEQA